jgi:NhaA family Na+:H+ antiporter
MPARKRTPPVERLIRPFQEFAHQASSGGILLLICSLVALGWANSPLAPSYFRLWQTPVEMRFGQWLDLDKPLLLWINDGLMAMFFFLVGMEIKRELLVGSYPRGVRRCCRLSLRWAAWWRLRLSSLC